MTLTSQLLDHLRATDYLCSRLTSAQAEELLAVFAVEPAPEPPFVWDEETIWHTIRKITGH